MKIPRNAALLRIYLGETQTAEGRPLFETIVLKAREMGMAGATVVRGPMGFGERSILHTAKVLRLSEDLPMIIEIVDDRAKIDKFAPVIGPMVSSGLVTIEQVEVLQYGDNSDGRAKDSKD